MDPSDRLELAASRLEAALARGELPEFLRDRAVFIDEFDTFNAPSVPCWRPCCRWPT